MPNAAVEAPRLSQAAATAVHAHAANASAVANVMNHDSNPQMVSSSSSSLAHPSSAESNNNAPRAPSGNNSNNNSTSRVAASLARSSSSTFHALRKSIFAGGANSSTPHASSSNGAIFSASTSQVAMPLTTENANSAPIRLYQNEAEYVSALECVTSVPFHFNVTRDYVD